MANVVNERPPATYSDQSVVCEENRVIGSLENLCMYVLESWSYSSMYVILASTSRDC